MREVMVDGSALVIEDVVAVARGQARAILGPDVAQRMEVSRAVVVQALSGGAPVYGVNTGFGALVDTPIGEADLTTLQGAIVRSHAAGIGVPWTTRWCGPSSCSGPGPWRPATRGCGSS